MPNLNRHPTADKPRISVELVREATGARRSKEGLAQMQYYGQG